jgi:hypothetical protein
MLMITPILGAENCASMLTKQLAMEVEIATNRRDGLAKLRRKEYSIVVIDGAIVDADPEAAEALWKYAGFAVPMQFNFAISGTARLVREVRAVLDRREQEKTVAMRAATMAVENELRDVVTGLVLHSQLALTEPEIPAALSARLKTVAALAGALREKLGSEAPNAANASGAR